MTTDIQKHDDMSRLGMLRRFFRRPVRPGNGEILIRRWPVFLWWPKQLADGSVVWFTSVTRTDRWLEFFGRRGHAFGGWVTQEYAR